MTEKQDVRCAKCHARLVASKRCKLCGLPFCSMHVHPSSHGCEKQKDSGLAKTPTPLTRLGRRFVVLFITGIVVTVVIAASIFWGLGQKDQKPAQEIQWIRTEKLRAGYGVPLNISVVSKMKLSGMNAIIYPIRYYDTDDPDQGKNIREKAMLCKEAGIRLFISIFYFIRDAGREVQARSYVISSGDQTAAPCPLDWTYWQNAILRQATALAELSNQVPIAGLVLDTEMYTSEGAHIYSDNGCYCDDCFNGFMTGRPDQGPGGRDLRMSWLEDQELLDDYHDYLRKKVRSVAQRIRTEINNINPKFLLGFLLYDHNWYYRGLTEGLGEPKTPVLVFDESTYGQGWCHLSMQMVRYFPRMGYDVFYIPGLWLAHLAPDRIESEVYYCGSNADGYWIFPLDSLFARPETLSGDFVLNGSQDAYWKALSHADSQIDLRLAMGDEYQSPIPYHPKTDRSISFRLAPEEYSIRIVNNGFAPRFDLKVAINGRLAAKIHMIDIKSSSNSILYEPNFTGSADIYGQHGLSSVAVMEEDGIIHQLLGFTALSTFE